jgi:hypothetical protein
MKDKFEFMSDEGKRSLPIIPDYKVESYDPDKKLFLPEINVGEFPKVDYDKLILNDLRPKIAKRVTAILDKLDHELKQTKVRPPDHPMLIKSKPINQWLRNSWLGRFFISTIFKIGKRWINGQLNRWITNQIILDMSNHGLFRDDANEPDNVLK